MFVGRFVICAESCAERSPRELRGAPTLIENAKIASRVRAWNCLGPGTASKSTPEAPEGCVLR
eukprot:6995557-Alexandrium_andersonii.AAC.1